MPTRLTRRITPTRLGKLGKPTRLPLGAGLADEAAAKKADEAAAKKERNLRRGISQCSKEIGLQL